MRIAFASIKNLKHDANKQTNITCCLSRAVHLPLVWTAMTRVAARPHDVTRRAQSSKTRRDSEWESGLLIFFVAWNGWKWHEFVMVWLQIQGPEPWGSTETISRKFGRSPILKDTNIRLFYFIRNHYQEKRTWTCEQEVQTHFDDLVVFLGCPLQWTVLWSRFLYN